MYKIIIQFDTGYKQTLICSEFTTQTELGKLTGFTYNTSANEPRALYLDIERIVCITSKKCWRWGRLFS